MSGPKPHTGNLFTKHPRSIGESYGAHMREALGFGGAMLAGGMACLVHAVFPFLFETTGSRSISRLHERMVANRVRRHDPDTR